MAKRTERLDDWMRLVLKTMGVEELKAESENLDNGEIERRAMRAELARRG